MYDEKYVRRGEIYSIRMDNNYGSEQGTTRPGLIISNDVGNNTSPTVVVAYMTTRDHNIGIHYGPTKATGRPSFVQCEQLATVDKRRLGYLMGQLSSNEMKEVEDRLDEALDMGYIDDTPLKEKEAECAALKIQKDNLEAEIFRLKKQISAHEDELLGKDVEIAVAKRMYEKAVGIIAAMRSEPDLPKPPQYIREIERVKADKPVEEAEEKSLPDINTATFSQLRSAGFTNGQVLATINGRPYRNLEDLKNAPGINSKAYNILSKRVCCIPAEADKPVEETKAILDDGAEPEIVGTAAPQPKPSGKVNINTATWGELVEKTGISKLTAQNIIAYRNKCGSFSSVEDLLNVARFGKTCLKKYGPLLEV